MRRAAFFTAKNPPGPPISRPHPASPCQNSFHILYQAIKIKYQKIATFTGPFPVPKSSKQICILIEQQQDWGQEEYSTIWSTREIKMKY